MSAETRANISEALKRADHSWKVGRKQSAETVSKRAEKNKIARMGKRSNEIPAVGSYKTVNGGYLMLTGQNHPLAKGGEVLEHRKALYDLIGPGPHECYWNSRYGCEETSLEWSGGTRLVVDHLDGNKVNNSPDNLVPSCTKCNSNREKYEKVIRLALERVVKA